MCSTMHNRMLQAMVLAVVVVMMMMMMMIMMMTDIEFLISAKNAKWTMDGSSPLVCHKFRLLVAETYFRCAPYWNIRVQEL